MSKYSKEILEAYSKAKAIREKAYAPYSKFKVGCCLQTKSGKTYLGHNIENVAFPSCTCAENIALGNAIVAEGRGTLDFIVIVADGKDPVSPCGNCRQIIAEHVDKDFLVYLANLKEITTKITMSELLPLGFKSLS